ncbi:MAG: DUF4340 domain-containing protein [Gemmatimonadota bacterium]
MTGRQLGGVFGVLALLLAAWFFVRGRDGGDPADGLDLGAMVGGDVTYVLIAPPEAEPIELERRSTGWTVNGYPALDSLVDATLARLDTLPAGRLIARNPASHERMGLTEDAAVRVRVGPAGEPEADFLVGDAGIDGRFVRLPDTDPAYVFPGAAIDPLAAPERSWRDFTVIRADTSALRRIVIRQDGEIAAELSRADADGPGWSVEGPAVDGAAADTAVMRVYLETLADLQATGFPADSFVFAADFENPIAVVELYDTDEDDVAGPDAALLFSTGLDHPDVLVRRADDPIVYAIERPVANLLTASAARLLGR